MLHRTLGIILVSIGVITSFLFVGVDPKIDAEDTREFIEVVRTNKGGDLCTDYPSARAIWDRVSYVPSLVKVAARDLAPEQVQAMDQFIDSGETTLLNEKEVAQSIVLGSHYVGCGADQWQTIVSKTVQDAGEYSQYAYRPAVMTLLDEGISSGFGGVFMRDDAENYYFYQDENIAARVSEEYDQERFTACGNDATTYSQYTSGALPALTLEFKECLSSKIKEQTFTYSPDRATLERALMEIAVL